MVGGRVACATTGGKYLLAPEGGAFIIGAGSIPAATSRTFSAMALAALFKELLLPLRAPYLILPSQLLTSTDS